MLVARLVNVIYDEMEKKKKKKKTSFEWSTALTLAHVGFILLYING